MLLPSVLIILVIGLILTMHCTLFVPLIFVMRIDKVGVCLAWRRCKEGMVGLLTSNI